jgi:hypothetical protein
MNTAEIIDYVSRITPARFSQTHPYLIYLRFQEPHRGYWTKISLKGVSTVLGKSRV